MRGGLRPLALAARAYEDWHTDRVRTRARARVHTALGRGPREVTGRAAEIRLACEARDRRAVFSCMGARS